jgi:hypothetical protein
MELTVAHTQFFPFMSFLLLAQKLVGFAAFE